VSGCLGFVFIYAHRHVERYVPSTSTIVSVHADQNILFHSLSSKSLIRQLIGFNDEIIDATFLSPRASPQSEPPVTALSKDTHIALATNSSLIRVYSTSGMNARLLSGHTEIVLCLDHGIDGRILASGSKDRSARIWAPSKPNPEHVDANQEWGCVAICEGHAESVLWRCPAKEANMMDNWDSCSLAAKIGPSKCGICPVYHCRTMVTKME